MTVLDAPSGCLVLTLDVRRNATVCIVATRHECPQCGRKTQVGPNGNWYSHMRHDDPSVLCPLSAQPAYGYEPNPASRSIRADDVIQEIEIPPKKPLRPVVKGAEEGTSIRTISGGLPGSRRR